MPKEPKQYKSLKSFLNSKDVDLTALGWHVRTGEKHISLHRPLHLHGDECLPTPDITIEFNESYKTNGAHTLGPWLVKAKSLSSRRHTSLGKAIAYFIELAGMLAPGPGAEG
jgi:hypothetical protein